MLVIWLSAHNPVNYVSHHLLFYIIFHCVNNLEHVWGVLGIVYKPWVLILQFFFGFFNLFF